MKKVLLFICILLIIALVYYTFNAQSKDTNVQSAKSQTQDWLPNGEHMSVYEYRPNNPRSPAAFSSIDSQTLNAEQQKGQQVYARWCQGCHGAGMPGTNALRIVYKGLDIPEALEERTDLSADVVSAFVRYGKHSMPFFRKTEISGEELKYLGAYLSRNYK